MLVQNPLPTVPGVREDTVHAERSFYVSEMLLCTLLNDIGNWHMA